MNYLEKRQFHFAKALRATKFVSEAPLTGRYQISSDQLAELNTKVLRYLAASCHESFDSQVHNSSISSLESVLQKAKNISTSGMVIPKSHSAAQFTDIHKTLATILDQAGLRFIVDYWIYPFNIRLKGEQASRPDAAYPTETPHSETWVGCSLRSLLLHIPLMGDTKKNFLKVWRPKGDFTDSHLRPLKEYREVNEMIANCDEIHMNDQEGHILMVDSALLHGTYRAPEAQARVSMDLNIVIKEYETLPDEWHLLADRQKIPSKDFFEIGRSLKVTSVDSDSDIYSAPDGMRHPAHIKIEKI